MNLERLSIERFGPFLRYEIPFPKDNNVCLLLTGRNNEGKSNLIFALQLLRFGSKVLNSSRQRVVINGDEYFKLLQQDVGDLRVGRLVHNYDENVARVKARFSGGVELTVYIDPREDLIYADHKGRLPAGELFGFIPPLGRFAESEDRLSEAHIRKSIETTLAPRHFRNHLAQILSPSEVRLVQEIVRESWPGVELLRTEYDSTSNQLACFYKEGQYEREVSWAGQGLQVWFQVITHMVRLRDSAVLVLDEPEINLHPEKQNELIRLLREHHRGSVIIATHSVELMNNVGVSHIVHVQKRHTAPSIKSTSERVQLDLIRSRIGSNFNLVASQFEAVDTVVFTEDQSDFGVLAGLHSQFGGAERLFNIPLHGFSEYPKAQHYKHAYELLIGANKARFVVLLDRDYYPDSYLQAIAAELKAVGIETVFTIGKEIENLYLVPSVLAGFVPANEQGDWHAFWEAVFQDLYLDSLGSWTELHERFGGLGKGTKNALTKAKPLFDAKWSNPDERHLMLPGKKALSKVREFHQARGRGNLSQSLLLQAVAKNHPHVNSWLREVVGVAKPPKKK